MDTIITVPAIVTIVYTIIELLKRITGQSEKFKKFIPLVALALGAISGVVCFYFIPGVLDVENIVVAIVIGAASGLSATGTNQVIKQLYEN